MKIGLIPLDERPVNVRLPQQVATIANIEILTPPADLLPRFRHPASHDALAAWLIQQASSCDALIVSIETLVYGGLIASRIHDTETETLTARLDVLRQIKAHHPDLPIYAFNLITRISRHNDNTEEPLYWATYGAKLFHLSQLIHQDIAGHDVTDELEMLKENIPFEYLADFTQRRYRNNIINRMVIDMVHENVIDLLVLSSDDTSQWGIASQEKAALIDHVNQYQLSQQVLMYPGADEIGAILVARLLNTQHRRPPLIYPQYLVNGGENIIAPFEDSPVSVTVERQISAVGAQIASTPDEADLLLLINPPVDSTSEWVRDRTSQELSKLMLMGETLKHLPNDKPLLVADVAFANGGDPYLINTLAEHIGLHNLTAYAGWNTAGNSIGTAIATGCAALAVVRGMQMTALLAHRIYEDLVYQTYIRAQIRKQHNNQEPANDAEVQAYQQEIFDAMKAHSPSICGWTLKPNSLRLPWRRTFEIDFDLIPDEDTP